METKSGHADDAVRACLDAFSKAWADDPRPPRIEDHLPPPGDPARAEALVGLIKADMRARGTRASLRPVELYFGQYREVCQDARGAAELILEDHRQREGTGPVPVDDLCARFPGYRSELRRLADGDARPRTRTLAAKASTGGGEAPAAASDDLVIGDQIDDFLLLGGLGEGAFAKVYLALQKSLQRTVALKVARAGLDEAQTLAQLDHPNIVRVHDQRELPERDVQLLYMEYVPGGTLEPVIERVRQTPVAARTGRLLLDAIDAALADREEKAPADSLIRKKLAAASWPQAVCMVGAQLATALDHAHRSGVLHRDVKPANVLLGANGAAKLADFNISYSSEVSASAEASIGGTFPYMSPEQLEACNPLHERKPEDLDARADIYALAIVLWELLTGTLPFPEESPDDGLLQLIERMTERRREGVPREAIDALPASTPHLLRETLLRCLAPEREDRVQSGVELARRLELGLHPRVELLLTPASRGWPWWLRRLPLVGLLFVGLVPNVVLSGLNILYNLHVAVGVEHWEQFQRQVAVVNGVAFPLGIGLMIWLTLPVARRIRQRERGIAVAEDQRASARRRAIRLANTLSGIILVLWIVGGLTFPLWREIEGGAEPAAYFHFTLSNLLFGVLAATACFFFLSFLIVRVLLPRLLEAGDTDFDAVDRMGRLRRRMAYYFSALTAVPFISVIVLGATESQQQNAYTVLGIMGALGFGVAYWLITQITRDLDALQVALGEGSRPGATR